ncbi:WD repeat-containing protein 17-like isoform X1 [Macrobrachium rosenbergii]|uniref:WD repeat-containing protein 17-like isoform X1 n=1 Tax=Macrobrachium rosenbergii TaxID=79674 RepID=UPI0034D3CEED
MSRWGKKKSYDNIHNYVERVEDVLLSESSWSTTDSECSGCLHLSRRGSLQGEGTCEAGLELATFSPTLTLDNGYGWNEYANANYIQSASTHCVLARVRACAAERARHVSSRHLKDTNVNRHANPLTEDGMLQQLALLAAGAQPWNHKICTAHSRRFAYAATLAIYVYVVEEGSSEYQLFSILADHRKTITCLDWHPTSEDLLASASLDQRVCVWSVSSQSVLYAISICRVPTVVAWCVGHRDLLSFSTQSGPVQLWAYTDNTEPYPYREDYGYSSGIITYRWHPSVPGRLVIGHEDGRITVYREEGGKLRYSAYPEGGEDCDDLVTLEWDTCSPDYILVAYRGGALWLVDVNSMRIITKYSINMSASISTLAWLPDAPGMFVTGDAEKGILRVWTVSKPTPLENYILKETGFHFLCATQASNCPRKLQSESNDRKGIMIPNVSVVTLFKDGGVGLYHLRRKQWIFRREHGHTETIFDCSFKPEDSDLLATSSFDGSIKIWRIDTMEAVDTLPNRNTIIYSISWAPADLNCIVAGTSAGDVFIWDIGKHKILQDICAHKDKKVFCVAWNQNDCRRIASAGESGYCYVHQVSGTLLQDYRHPGPVYGCDWRDADILATGCEDGRIRIFSVSKNRREPVTELKAHLKKVFRVKWNPVYSDILCSGSDDSSVRIWSFSKAQCLTILVGHSDNVRGLVWCPEVPFMLISGSWDRTLRVWDARHANCLDVNLDHGADVYGLSIHPIRPFLLASCSRDSTMRLWSLASFVAPLQLKVLSEKPIEEIIDGTDQHKSFSTGLHLCGLRADHLQATLEKTDVAHHSSKRLKLFADLFCGDVRVKNLWDLVYVLQGHTEISQLSPNYTQSIMHHSHLVKCSLAMAAEHEIDSNRGSGVGSRKYSTSESQEALAESYLRCGALQQYCELMIRLHQWDHALALAPAVSVDYWRKLVARHAEQLLTDDNEACVPYLLATRDADKLINFHIGRGHLDKAFSECVALSKMNRNSRKGPPPDVPPRGSSMEMNGTSQVQERTLECARLVAHWHLLRGSPIVAACALLAVDDIKGALLMLLRGHELELVVAVGRLVGLENSNLGNSETAEADLAIIKGLIFSAVRYLVYRAIRLSLWKLAIDLTKTLPKGTDSTVLQAEVLISFVGSHEEQESLYTYAEFPSPVECPEKALGPVLDQVMYLLLSTQPYKGLNKALEFLQDQIIGENIDRASVWYVLRLVQAIPLSQCGGQWAIRGNQRAGLLAVSAYLGAIRASVLEYGPVVPHLLSHASYIMEKHRPGGYEFLNEYIATAKIKWDQGDSNWGVDTTESPEMWSDVGVTRVSGSHLPRHSDSQICCITNRIIKGSSYFLENGESVMGLNDALMWAKVHPYSPLGTGHRLSPF